jgi:hypothetical protein
MSKIHRGKILHQVAKRSKKTIVQISDDAGYDQSTFYVHKDKEDLQLEILYRYGVAMDHDFSTEVPEMKDYMLEQGLKNPLEKKLSYEELEQDRNLWKDKYYALLEENNKLIKEKYQQK